MMLLMHEQFMHPIDEGANARQELLAFGVDHVKGQVRAPTFRQQQAQPATDQVMTQVAQRRLDDAQPGTGKRHIGGTVIDRNRRVDIELVGFISGNGLHLQA
mmetsp:Transcript_23511/g.58027  ORF Transcript_23511/g.58027 Transcript_23511/m.58027 type:complete len:102 (+) Transcript_23511:388-693(+)